MSVRRSSAVSGRDGSETMQDSSVVRAVTNDANNISVEISLCLYSLNEKQTQITRTVEGTEC